MYLQSKANLKLCINLRGALAYHILLKVTMFFQSYYHLSKLWSICCHQLPKRGRECIDHSQRERECVLLFGLSLLCLNFIVCLLDTLCLLCDHVFDHCYINAWLDDIISYILIWSFTCLVMSACFWFLSFWVLHQDVCDMEE